LPKKFAIKENEPYIISCGKIFTGGRMKPMQGIRLALVLMGLTLAFGSAIAGASLSKAALHTFSQKDIDILVKTVAGEARGEGARGMQAVAEVILNRLNHTQFPNTIEEVCKQNRQFSCWNSSDPNRHKIGRLHPQDRLYRQAHLAVSKALYDRRILPKNTTYFHTLQVSPRWATNKRRVAEIKGHVFYSA